MNIVIITTKTELYHRYLCAEIAKRHNVVGVLHPISPPIPSFQQRLKHHWKNARRYGMLWYLLQKLAKNRIKHFGWNMVKDVEQAETRYFPNAQADYQTYVADCAFDVKDINAPESVKLLAQFKPDVVVCSGGPIYRAPLIEAAGTMLNFHTGISPIYNGAWTVFLTYANRQPHLTGGTLMKMSTTVDGGNILAHYLPAVEAFDTPGSLFMKSIIGGTALYNLFLDDMVAGRKYLELPQGKPFRHYYAYEWTCYQTLTIERHIRHQICRKFIRDEIIAKYWDIGDKQTAKQLLKQTLLELVYNG